jgi:hypothetical protein
MLLLPVLHFSHSFPQVSILSGGRPLEPENSIEHSDLSGWLEQQPLIRLSALSGNRRLYASLARDGKTATTTDPDVRVSSQIESMQKKIKRLQDENLQLATSVRTLMERQRQRDVAGKAKDSSRTHARDATTEARKQKRPLAAHSTNSSPSDEHGAVVEKPTAAPSKPSRLPVITSWVEPPPPPPPKYAYPLPKIKQVPRGIHLALKPHELPEWADDKNGVANHYIDLLEQIMDTVHTRNSEINVIVDVPASYAEIVITRGGHTVHLAGLIQSIVDGVVVLTHAVTANDIVKQAEPFLAYAKGNRVVVAVELRCATAGGINLMGTFCGHDLNEMELILQQADKAMDHYVSYSGMAIDDINGYDAMQPVVQLSASLRAPREVYVSTGGFLVDQHMQTRLMKFSTQHEITAMYVEASEAVVDGQQDEIASLLTRAYEHGLKIDLLYSHTAAVLPQHHKAAKHWALSCILAFGHRSAGVYQTPEDFGLRVQLIGVKWDISNKLVIELQGNSETLEHLRIVADVHSQAAAKPIKTVYPGKRPYAELRYLPAHSTADVELGLGGMVNLQRLQQHRLEVHVNLTYTFNRNNLFQTNLQAVVQASKETSNGPWLSVGALDIDPKGSGWAKLRVTAVHSLVQVQANCWASNNVTVTYPHNRNMATLLTGPDLNRWHASSFKFRLLFPRGVKSTNLTVQASFITHHEAQTQLFNLHVVNQ